MPVKNISRLGVVVLMVAWCFDQLFWGKALGISFALFIFILLLAWLYLSRLERIQPAARSLILILPALVLSLLVFLRQEPFTQFIAIFLTFMCLALLAMSWAGGRWLEYNLRAMLIQSFWLCLSFFEKPLQVWINRQPPSAGSKPVETFISPGTPASSQGARLFGSLVFGLLLALPLVLVLAGLLASADLIFADKLSVLFDFLRVDKLLEYTLRLFLILLGAYLLSGAFLHSFISSQDEKVSTPQSSWPRPFLGWVEASTVLGSVVGLFAFFVAVQLRYFFGGHSNIRLDGFTYAEYARRGFFELLLVAWLSLLLILVLSALTTRRDRRARSVFSGLVSAVVVLVGIILISAFQRLLLYESAYGFTRLRAYTHVFMVWLGLLLLTTAILEFSGRLRHFALAAFLVMLAFGLTLGILNVDRFIVLQNVNRAGAGQKLDLAYLASLSEDAVNALFDLYLDPSIPQPVHDQIGAALVCHQFHAVRFSSSAQRRQSPWMSLHWSRYLSARHYTRYGSQLEAYTVRESQDGLEINVAGQSMLCQAAW